MRGGWVKVEHSSGVQIVNCVTEEKGNAGVQNLEKRGKLRSGDLLLVVMNYIKWWHKEI